MVEEVIMSARNVVDFARYQHDRAASKAQAISARFCRHCNAKLSEGEREDECSSAFNFEASDLHEAPRKFVRRILDGVAGS